MTTVSTSRRVLVPYQSPVEVVSVFPEATHEQCYLQYNVVSNPCRGIWSVSPKEIDIVEIQPLARDCYQSYNTLLQAMERLHGVRPTIWEEFLAYCALYGDRSILSPGTGTLIHEIVCYPAMRLAKTEGETRRELALCEATNESMHFWRTFALLGVPL